MFQVLDYVKERASLYELNKTVRMWERKVEIAEVKFDTSLSLCGHVFTKRYRLFYLKRENRSRSFDIAPSLETSN